MDVLYGRNAVTEALRAGRGMRRIWVAHGAHGLDDLFDQARRRRVPLEVTDRQRLDQCTPGHHQGVIAEVEPFGYVRLTDILDRAAQRQEPPLVVCLDSLQDPQNFGALLRTAQACGVHGVLIPEHRAVGVTPAVSNASAGAVEHMLVARETNLPRALNHLKSEGVWIFGLAVGAGQPFWEVDWADAAALVVGSEGTGLGRLVRATCDGLLHIPMAAGAVESLNAAVAGSVALCEAFRQRHAQGGPSRAT